VVYDLDELIFRRRVAIIKGYKKIKEAKGEKAAKAWTKGYGLKMLGIDMEEH